MVLVPGHVSDIECAVAYFFLHPEELRPHMTQFAKALPLDDAQRGCGVGLDCSIEVDTQILSERQHVRRMCDSSC